MPGASHECESGDHGLDLISERKECTDPRIGDDTFGGKIAPVVTEKRIEL